MAKDDPKKAVKALILFEGKYLLVLRNKQENIDPARWDIPGGGMEYGESQEGALIREVKEETTIDISSSRIVPIKTWEMEKYGIKIGGTDFLCVLSNSQPVVLSPEHVSFQWLSGEEIVVSKEIPDWIKEDVERAVKYLG